MLTTLATFALSLLGPLSLPPSVLPEAVVLAQPIGGNAVVFIHRNGQAVCLDLGALLTTSSNASNTSKLRTRYTDRDGLEQEVETDCRPYSPPVCAEKHKAQVDAMLRVFPKKDS